MAKPHSRRAVLGWIGLSCLPAGTALAQSFEELDPADLVPRRFTQKAFAAQTPEELYKTNLAVRRGRSIRIDGCSTSESRAIIRRAVHDRQGALEMLRGRC